MATTGPAWQLARRAVRSNPKVQKKIETTVVTSRCRFFLSFMAHSLWKEVNHNEFIHEIALNRARGRRYFLLVGRT